MTRTVDFNDFPIKTKHIDWLSVETQTETEGFLYTNGSGNGQRPDKHGVAWPTPDYYEQVLGAGGFDVVKNWQIKPVIIYAQEIGNDYHNLGWNHYQDMCEGSTCIDDTARTAIMFAEDYILNNSTESFQKARDALTFVAYLVTSEGKVYNFAWLNSAKFFGWSPIQSLDNHFGYRCEYVRRTQYPSDTPNSDWMSPSADPASIILNNGNPVDAFPFIPHPQYSVSMDDLLSTSGDDVAETYEGPLYSDIDGPVTSTKFVKKDWSTSSLNMDLTDMRALFALAKGLHMVQAFINRNGALDADQTFFAKFLENHINRIIYNLQLYDIKTFDVKLASNALMGLTEYYYAVYGTPPYGRYELILSPDSNTSSPFDNRPEQGKLYSMIADAQTKILSCQYTTSDWRSGIFIDDREAGNWNAWGELQMFALAKVYKLKINIGETPEQLDDLLTQICFAADNFYGQEAYHYTDASGNYIRTKERITNISNWEAIFHTNGDQFCYQNSSIVVGLKELAEAYYLSGRSDAEEKRQLYLEYAKIVASWFLGNNSAITIMYDASPESGSAPFDAQGTAFDGIISNAGSPFRSNGAGAESSAEALWAMVIIKKALLDYNISTTFTFDY